MSQYFKAGDKVVMHSCEIAKKQKYKGIIWTVEEDSSKSVINDHVKLEYYGHFLCKNLQLVLLDKSFCPEGQIQNISCTADQAGAVRKKFHELGIITLETTIETWWGGKGCIEFTFKGQLEDYSRLVDFCSKLD